MLIDRYRRSSDSCVRPLCDFDPRIVWLWAKFRTAPKPPTHELHQTFPEPVTPNVASKPSLPSLITPSTRGTTPASRNRSICSASSSKTFVKANFSVARLRDSLGGFRVMWVGISSCASCTGDSTVSQRSGGGRSG